MKKPVIIPIKKLIQKILATGLVFLCLMLLFSLKIPHQICRKLTNDLLIQREEPFSHRLFQLFSFSSGATVYAAMPMEKPSVKTKLETAIPPTPIATPAPVTSPPPGANLSGNSTNLNIQIKNHTQKTFDISELLAAPFPYQKNNETYKVLLVHTHTTECYFPNDRSENSEENMIRIGKEFQSILEENGIPTLHITTVHDIPYTTSYKKSLESVNKALQEYPSIEVVIDLHRDAIYAENGEKLRPITQINGVDTAQVMLVCGTDEGGLPHPNWKQNLSFAAKVQHQMQKHYPNLARPLDLRKERFNTHTTKNSVIFEIGSHGNSLEEAILGARLAAQSVANVLNAAN